MNDPNHRWAEELQESVGAIKAMRDELKVQVHMASMEARAKFEALERRLDQEQLNARKSMKTLVDEFNAVKNEMLGKKH